MERRSTRKTACPVRGGEWKPLGAMRGSSLFGSAEPAPRRKSGVCRGVGRR